MPFRIAYPIATASNEFLPLVVCFPHEDGGHAVRFNNCRYNPPKHDPGPGILKHVPFDLPTKGVIGDLDGVGRIPVNHLVNSKGNFGWIGESSQLALVLSVVAPRRLIDASLPLILFSAAIELAQDALSFKTATIGPIHSTKDKKALQHKYLTATRAGAHALVLHAIDAKLLYESLERTGTPPGIDDLRKELQRAQPSPEPLIIGVGPDDLSAIATILGLPEHRFSKTAPFESAQLVVHKLPDKKEPETIRLRRWHKSTTLTVTFFLCLATAIIWGAWAKWGTILSLDNDRLLVEATYFQTNFYRPDPAAANYVVRTPAMRFEEAQEQENVAHLIESAKEINKNLRVFVPRGEIDRRTLQRCIGLSFLIPDTIAKHDAHVQRLQEHLFEYLKTPEWGSKCPRTALALGVLSLKTLDTDIAVAAASTDLRLSSKEGFSGSDGPLCYLLLGYAWFEVFLRERSLARPTYSIDWATHRIVVTPPESVVEVNESLKMATEAFRKSPLSYQGDIGLPLIMTFHRANDFREAVAFTDQILAKPSAFVTPRLWALTAFAHAAIGFETNDLEEARREIERCDELFTKSGDFLNAARAREMLNNLLQPEASSRSSPSSNAEAPSPDLRWRPYLTLGQSDWNTSGFGPYSATADGHRFYVADRYRHRVLIWNSARPTGDATPDLVLGQPSNRSGAQNHGGLSGTSMAEPTAVATDGQRLYVADSWNKRVLVWTTPPTRNGQTADIVLGQQTFNENKSGVTATAVSYVEGLATDGRHLFASDRYNHRVLIWNTPPTRNGQPADVVVGQPNFGTSIQLERSNSRSLALPTGVSTDGTRLVVADTGNHRILIWNAIPKDNYQPADVVLGQPTFDTATPGNERLFSEPRGVLLVEGRLYVADTNNRRVLVWNAVPVNHFVPPDEILDQVISSADQKFFTLNPIYRNLIGPTGICKLSNEIIVSDWGYTALIFWEAQTIVTGQLPSDIFPISSPTLPYQVTSYDGRVMSRPNAVASDGDMLAVCDAFNRVLLWRHFPRISNDPPDVVLCQEKRQNGLPPIAISTSASSLRQPSSIAISGEKLIVADGGNNRVLIWNKMPDRDSAPADLILGQPSFLSNAENDGGIGPQSLKGPTGIATDGKYLFVSDSGNQRVLIWLTFPDEARKAADVVLGQPDFVSCNDYSQRPSANTVSWPSGVATDGNRLFVVDSGHSRILVWNRIPRNNFQAADIVLGHDNFDEGNGGMFIHNKSLLHPESVVIDRQRLFVSDSFYNRILLWSSIPKTLGVPADGVIGQEDFSGIYPSSLNGHFHSPRSAIVIREMLAVADSGNNRVVILSSKRGNEMRVSDLQAPERVSGPVVINYTLEDAERDLGSIEVYYSIDCKTWQPAQIHPTSGDIAYLTTSPDGILHTLIWDSQTDLGKIRTNVHVKVVPKDKDGIGIGWISNEFEVDNQSLK